MTAQVLEATRADLFRALGVLAEPPGAARERAVHDRLAELVGMAAPDRSAWTEAFVVQLVPHASVYLSEDGMLGGVAADRVAGFWRALRLPVPADADHVAALLGLYATVVEAEAGEPAGPRRVLLHEARAALLHEHLLSWLLAYTSAMSAVGPPAYAAWSELLREALLAETAAVSDAGGSTPLPIHLRDQPGNADRRDVIDELLAPARTGFILTRADLARAARQHGLGVRLGDRRLMLRSLMEQDPPGTLRWLADHARSWAARSRTDETVAGPIAAYWTARAAQTAERLDSARRGLNRSERENGERPPGLQDEPAVRPPAATAATTTEGVSDDH
ncbi:MAG TPA: molecular chaperone TorD family protein [Jiangellaceae bacterium]